MHKLNTMAVIIAEVFNPMEPFIKPDILSPSLTRRASGVRLNNREAILKAEAKRERKAAKRQENK